MTTGINTKTVALIAVFSVMYANGANGAKPDYQAHYMYLGESPSNASPGWDEQPRGIAHDESHWFITNEQLIWRIPVVYHLGDVYSDTPGVAVQRIQTIQQLWDEGYTQFGDPCTYRHGDAYYLLVPTQRGGAPWDLAVFRIDQLSFEFVDVGSYPDNGGHDFEWCGMDSDGYLYNAFSDVTVFGFRRYAVNWPALAQDGVLSMTSPETIPLYTENGAASTSFHSVLCADVSPDGKLLYLAGYQSSSDDEESIHVFDVASGWRVQRSTTGSGYFNYEPDTPNLSAGMTIWELEGTGSPHIGNLHVVIHDRDLLSGDEVSVKHYTNTIAVVPNTNPLPAYAFHTIGGAINFAWDSAEIGIQAGNYNEPMTITKRIRLRAYGGTVRIGD